MQNRLVYDSEQGRIVGPSPKRRGNSPPPKDPGAGAPRDGVVRLLRDRKGRGGKTVTLVVGLSGGTEELARVATELKRACGTGGSIKGDVVEIQGDHRERICLILREQGHLVKLAGG